MKCFLIPKKSGGTRAIYVPNSTEKARLRESLSLLTPRLKAVTYAHGFVPGRSIVTNALPHKGKAVTISFDLAEFFDSVTVEKFGRGTLPEGSEEWFVLGPDGKKAARQGLPTSPALANLAAKPLDEAIVKGLKKKGITAVYTRYADDLSISLDKDDPGEIELAKQVVAEAVARCGFRLNKKKTRVQRAKSGRREICGLMVDETGVHIPRRIKRKIRAARHAYRQACLAGDSEAAKKAANSLAGLLEFSLLKAPNAERRQARELERTKKRAFRQAQKLVKVFDLHWGIDEKVKKMIPERVLDGGRVIITNDPVYLLGISSFSRKFTSCMKLGEGSHHKGVAFWQRHPGVSVALELEKEGETVTIRGVTRRAIRSRTLLYHLRNGVVVFGDIYGGGNGHAVDVDRYLAKVLMAEGIRPCYEHSGELVSGNVIREKGGRLPYFDNVTEEFITLRPSGRSAIRLRVK
jgi:hypothetical protein